MNIENIKETNFTKDVNNLPITSDDNVLNKLDGFHDDTRMLGMELTLKALSEHKINKHDSIFASGSAQATGIGNYVRLTDTLLHPDISNRWLVFAIFDTSNGVDKNVTCKLEDNQQTMLAKAIRFNASGGGGATFAWVISVTSNRRIYAYATADSSVGNVRCNIVFIPL